jgi:prepilin-type N-terminal cleavage/methylation domain-containing protein
MHLHISKALPRSARGQSGATLVEMMVVVIIIGLVSAMAIPRFTNWVSALRVGGAANQIASDVAYTRMMAVREGHTASMTLSGTTYTIVVENTDGSVRRTLRTVKVANTYSGTTVTGEGGNGRVAFDSRGMLKSNSTSAITMSRLGRSQRLTISAIGRVTRETAQ